ncbi:CAP domain-containing protein [Demequina sp. NBRC 110052]|uniref:CAP domain-containing protein n=1 Tax=Demequina sp. NBRC 110052 TaxID=1570341 RepID=UPI000A066BC6|nr:CAP domain-containing protein [Demequina sp. NBRC 110052]
MYARQRSITAALVALLVTAVTFVAAPAAQAVSYDDPAGEIIKQTNAHRASHDGLGGLTRSVAMDAVAQAWAEKLASDYAAAKSVNPSTSPRDFLKHNPSFADQIPTGWKAAGENVAWNSGYPDPVTQMVKQWVNSSGHHDNLASTKYTHMGVGFYTDQYNVSWGVQVFAKYTDVDPDAGVTTGGSSEDTTTTPEEPSGSGSESTGDSGAKGDGGARNGTDTITSRNGSHYFFRNGSYTNSWDYVSMIGKSTDGTLVGDWDGDGIDTIASRNGNMYYFHNTPGSNKVDYVAAIGKATDGAVVGDWDGDGIDTIASRNGCWYFFRNTPYTNSWDKVRCIGRSTDGAVVGDWDGDGIDTIASRNGNHYFFRNTPYSNSWEKVVGIGRSTDGAVVGDWDGDGIDTITSRNGCWYFFRDDAYTNSWGEVRCIGRSTDGAIVGNWDGR